MKRSFVFFGLSIISGGFSFFGEAADFAPAAKPLTNFEVKLMSLEEGLTPEQKAILGESLRRCNEVYVFGGPDHNFVEAEKAQRLKVATFVRSYLGDGNRALDGTQRILALKGVAGLETYLPTRDQEQEKDKAEARKKLEEDALEKVKHLTYPKASKSDARICGAQEFKTWSELEAAIQKDPNGVHEGFLEYFMKVRAEVEKEATSANEEIQRSHLQRSASEVNRQVQEYAKGVPTLQHQQLMVEIFGQEVRGDQFSILNQPVEKVQALLGVIKNTENILGRLNIQATLIGAREDQIRAGYPAKRPRILRAKPAEEEAATGSAPSARGE